MTLRFATGLNGFRQQMTSGAAVLFTALNLTMGLIFLFTPGVASGATLRFETGMSQSAIDQSLLGQSVMELTDSKRKTQLASSLHSGEFEIPTDAAPTIGLTLQASQVALQRSTGMTCAHTPVTALRLDLGPLKLVWINSAALESGSVVITVENTNLKGGQYICEIDGKEFDAVFGTQGAEVRSTVTSISGCNIQCGGVQVNDGAPAFSTLGAVSVFGIAQTAVGRVQQHATIPVTINYAP